jgi:hypothetical protein
MTKFEYLSRAVVWLSKREWGLAFLLAFASFWAIIGVEARWPGGKLAASLEGPVFRAGFYLGTVTFKDYAQRGTTAFYIVPLFGVIANFAVLMGAWLILVRIACYMKNAVIHSFTGGTDGGTPYSGKLLLRCSRESIRYYVVGRYGL